jgi:plastocyanin
VSSSGTTSSGNAAAAALRRGWGRRALWLLPLAAVIAVLAGWGAVVAYRPAMIQARFLVSQQGRAFNPGELTIKRGDVVRIVNDDGDLTHHAYIQSPGMDFDSGDQAPGRDVNIAFDVPGTFNVLCGIHPKMRLTVKVEP